MPTISIQDENGAELFKTDLAGQGLGKYLKSAASLRAAVPLSETFAKPLADAAGVRELALALDTNVPVGESSELTLSAGASVGLGVHHAGSAILAGSDLQAPVTVPNGTVYVALTLEAHLQAGLAGTKGRIGFGFEAGTALRYAYFHPLNSVGSAQTVGEGVAATLAGAVFPADADDVAALPLNAHVSLAGDGQISFSAQATLSSTTNLLATPGLPIVGSVALAQAASVNVKADYAASGEFELRVSRVSAAQARLAFYRRRGRSLTVAATAMTGLAIDVRGRELIATLAKAISPNAEVDLVNLVNAELSDEQIQAIQHAVAASIDRSLTLSAQLQVSSVREDEALFAYEIDLPALDDAGKSAIVEALHGRLSAIGQLASTGPAIRLTTSAATRLRERKSSWRINLLGILNFASFTELVKQGSVSFDQVTGALTAADHVSTRRIRVDIKTFASEPEKLRRVLMESLMVTAAYQASRVLASTVSLTAEHTYFEQRGRTKRQDFADHYRALIALGLCDESERDARLGLETEFGSSTFVIENRFDAAACDAMFLDADGHAHTMDHYEGIARRALLALLPAEDPNRAFRRQPLASDELWDRVRPLGGALRSALGHMSEEKRLFVESDVFTIIWWATAMHRAATELVVMRKFIGARDAATLNADPEFTKARARLSDRLGDVVATTKAHFDDPWDVLAMDAAAARRGRLDGIIISTRFAARYADTDTGLVDAAPARLSRDVRAAVATPAASRPRDWTPEERDVFSRHVVNLSAGKLSPGGTFTSSREQVERIFRDLVPAYARQQRMADKRPRVVFFAHGGLNDEREGLLPVLARRRFWELNGIYPVYFVWETGIKETLRDIFAGGDPERAAARGPVTDFAIETAARRGREVWTQMKRNAETAGAVDGGTRLVAELSGELWKQLNAEIEFHAIGHSAGAILHAHFLPALVAQRPSAVPAVNVTTLHLLAPAVTIDVFKARLRKLTGPGQPITRLTMFTMTDDLETADPSLKPYGKSLLYLVSGAFEDAVPTRLLGLQKSLKQDLDMIRFFGLGGTNKVADVIFSKTQETAALDTKSEAHTHGGFDNDVATMTSVLRRILDVSNASPVVDYFEDAIAGFDRVAVGVPPAATL